MDVRAIPAAARAAVTASPAAVAAPAQPDAPDWLDPKVVAARNAAGKVAETQHGHPQPHIAKQGAPSYFRTDDQVEAAMKELAAKYPNLVELTDIGDSGDKTRGTGGHDIWQLTLTNKGANAGKKPGVFYVGGTHAREIANPELLLKWANQLLSGYGTDANATSLLDTREIRIVPIMNPDGHQVIEHGYATGNSGELWQRKNTTPGKGGNGVDLNRNYDYNWSNTGASGSWGSDIFHGPAPASESETKAIEGAVLAAKPGIFVDWHSYSRLNLFPWGDTRNHADDYEGLKQIATKFSGYNHYTPEQAIDLYPTSGTSHDFGYGRTKQPSFVVETGDNFHQSDKEFDESYTLNEPVMEYGARIADDPYKRAFGPDATAVSAAADGAATKLTATLSAGKKGTVAGAEWTTDPFAAPGTGTPLAAADGAFDGASEQVNGSVPSQAAAGSKLVYVRGRDAAGNWGPLTPQWLATATAAASK